MSDFIALNAMQIEDAQWVALGDISATPQGWVCVNAPVAAYDEHVETYDERTCKTYIGETWPPTIGPFTAYSGQAGALYVGPLGFDYDWTRMFLRFDLSGITDAPVAAALRFDDYVTPGYGADVTIGLYTASYPFTFSGISTQLATQAGPVPSAGGTWEMEIDVGDITLDDYNNFGLKITDEATTPTDQILRNFPLTDGRLVLYYPPGEAP